MAASKKKAAKKPAKKAAPKAAKAPAKKAKPAKKAAAKPAKKKTTAKKSAAPKKASAKSAAKPKAKPPAKKAAKSAAKKAPAAAAESKPKKKTAAKPAKKAAVAPKKGAAKAKKDAALPAAPAKKQAGKKAKGKAASGKKARPKKPILPMGPRHPKLGFKWICFACGAKFYDLGKEEPVCPKCETNQQDRPRDDPKSTTSDAPKAKVVRPMAQLLDDEEPAPAPGDEMAMDKKPASPTEEMFDATDGEAAGLDIDEEAETDGTAEPPEIDVV